MGKQALKRTFLSISEDVDVDEKTVRNIFRASRNPGSDTVSVVELRVLKLRLLQGMEENAKRGELVRLLAPGYVRDVAGKIVKDPNLRYKKRSHWSSRNSENW